MVTVGIDAHKNTHTLVAVNENGKRIGEITVDARPKGHEALLSWLRDLDDVTVAVEDCRHLTRRLEADLLIAGHRVVRVHTRLMAGMRRGARERGKSDPIDAEAVARVALREDNLPTAVLAGPSRDIKLFSDHRKLLVEQRTGLQAKLRWFLHELDPELCVPSRGMRRFCVLESLATELAEKPGAVAEIARDMLSDILALTHRINAIERQLSAIVRVEYPALLQVPGMGVLGAAMIVGETAGVTRFRNKDCFARFNGTAPIPVWSSNKVRVRLSRGGNRRINTCLHMAAVTQLRLGDEGAAYFAKQIDAGKTRTEAFRLLRRRISDRAFAALRADAQLHANEPTMTVVAITLTPKRATGVQAQAAA
ncbi:IS110 family transposase [Cryobacterium levicorallinum]|uniref:Transposase n=1 Tax=Cryobacterium levicorallinum TaxID=995038 RepID=A0A1I3EQI9_9MICO|nr:IS110 family transposase [Cryobacterium levicorallinum]TFB81468.1 IS110 family transposase [Cryobacterium levicorallinum]GEP28835.1 IS110 family transposase [Cryobacterium levicorallinum]SFI01133.1 Transposase [Cryobacterium levicorallinum]